ncbi:hypothetical protein TNCV_657431 [Trichonephila clavipes]|nr:hypothetical protein TNCV_657431 [Trichonephila clavipes]
MLVRRSRDPVISGSLRRKTQLFSGTFYMAASSKIHLTSPKNFAFYKLVCGRPSTTFRSKTEAIKCKLGYSCPDCSFSSIKTLFFFAIGLIRLYEARSFNIKPFSDDDDDDCEF